jgi:hypothetical protein
VIECVCRIHLSTDNPQIQITRLPIRGRKLQGLLHRLGTAETGRFFASNHHAFAWDSTQWHRDTAQERIYDLYGAEEIANTLYGDEPALTAAGSPHPIA